MYFYSVKNVQDLRIVILNLCVVWGIMRYNNLRIYS